MPYFIQTPPIPLSDGYQLSQQRRKENYHFGARAYYGKWSLDSATKKLAIKNIVFFFHGSGLVRLPGIPDIHGVTESVIDLNYVDRDVPYLDYLASLQNTMVVFVGYYGVEGSSYMPHDYGYGNVNNPLHTGLGIKLGYWVQSAIEWFYKSKWLEQFLIPGYPLPDCQLIGQSLGGTAILNWSANCQTPGFDKGKYHTRVKSCFINGSSLAGTGRGTFNDPNKVMAMVATQMHKAKHPIISTYGDKDQFGLPFMVNRYKRVNNRDSKSSVMVRTIGGGTPHSWFNDKEGEFYRSVIDADNVKAYVMKNEGVYEERRSIANVLTGAMISPDGKQLRAIALDKPLHKTNAERRDSVTSGFARLLRNFLATDYAYDLSNSDDKKEIIAVESTDIVNINRRVWNPGDKLSFDLIMKLVIIECDETLSNTLWRHGKAKGWFKPTEMENFIKEKAKAFGLPPLGSMGFDSTFGSMSYTYGDTLALIVNLLTMGEIYQYPFYVDMLDPSTVNDTYLSRAGVTTPITLTRGYGDFVNEGLGGMNGQYLTMSNTSGGFDYLCIAGFPSSAVNEPSEGKPEGWINQHLTGLHMFVYIGTVKGPTPSDRPSPNFIDNMRRKFAQEAVYGDLYTGKGRYLQNSL